jgi:hypothetical protein
MMNFENIIKKEISELYIGNLDLFEETCMSQYLTLENFPFNKGIKICFKEINNALCYNREDKILDLENKYNFIVTPFILEQYEVWNCIKRILNKELITNIDNSLLERIYFRIKLCKEGWSEAAIENSIIKYFKDDVKYKEIDKKITKWTYYRLRNLLIIKKNIIGRPKIPPSIKTMIEEYKKKKNRDIMREKYNIDKDLNKLFTEEEINKLIELLKFDKHQVEDSLKELKEKNFFIGLHFLVYKKNSNHEALIEKLGILKKYT